MEIIKVENLTKIYRNKGILRTNLVKAIDNLSFSLSEAEVLGLLGPNGAGKTTILKMLIGYSSISEGKIEINGEKIKNDFTDFRKQIGFLPENLYIPEYYRVEEFLEFCAALSGINKSQMQKNIKDYVDNFGLTNKLKRKIGELSMGQKRAVEIIQAFVNNPQLVLLDEPTVYLDPLIMQSFKNLIRISRAKGHGIIISSHVLNQIQESCDRVLIIDKGRNCVYGSVAELTKEKNLEKVFLDAVGSEK